MPAWRAIDGDTFLDPHWQDKQAVTRAEQLGDVLGASVDPGFLRELAGGLARAPMSVRLTPYVISLIDWSAPLADPLRRQFLPLACDLEPDHPLLTLDSTSEVADSPVPGLTHRYTDRVLMLVTDICPVYCRFCTRSYAVGSDTGTVHKLHMGVDRSRWRTAFDYIAAHPELEDVVVSGGDLYRLTPAHLREVADALLALDHVRRIRFATKGLAIAPMKILRDEAWTGTIVELAARARREHKEIVVHTHFNHPNEITGITEDALNLLHEQAITVRNLSVMQRGVNDSAETQITLNRKLTWLNVRPYYTYMCDMVKGIDDLRTPVWQGIEIARHVRGASSGPYTPLFVVDPPGGCGKRDIHSFEHYDRTTGLSVYAAPSVKPGRLFVYADPLRCLPPEVRRAWGDPRAADAMVAEALAKARAHLGEDYAADYGVAPSDRPA